MPHDFNLRAAAACIAGAAVILSAHAQPAAERSCSFEVKARCVSGEARVRVADGAPSALSIEVHWCGRSGTPGYSCSVNYSRGDGQSKWSAEAGAVLLDNGAPSNPGQPDRIKLIVGKHVSIDLEQAQSSGACGAGAELPRAIVIPERGGACRVWLDAP